LKKVQPAFVLEELGGNDRRVGIDRSTIVAGLVAIIKCVQENTEGVVLMMEVIPDGIEEAVCEKTGALLVPLDKEIAAAIGTGPGTGKFPRLPSSFFQRDGVHPNHRAQALISRAVCGVLGEQDRKPLTWSVQEAFVEVEASEAEYREKGEADALDCNQFCALM
jgi:hypothetical protein